MTSTRTGKARRHVSGDPLVRRLTAATLVNTFGNGLFMTISALFFTRSVGLSATQVGLGLTLAGGFGILAGIPAGHLADHMNPRRLLVVLLLLEAAAMATYTQVHSMATFVPAVCAVAVLDRSGSAVRYALIAIALPPEQRTATRAFLRAVTNVGIGAGAAIAAVALQADTRAAYLTLILLDALTFVGAAAVLAGLPLPQRWRPASRATNSPRRRAIADAPYLLITVLNALIALQFGLLEVGVPLWIAGHTHAPRALVSVMFILNTVLVAAFQVRASRGIDTVASAVRGFRRGGMLLGASCLVYAAASGSAPWLAATVLIVGAIVHTGGELISSAAGWQLSYDLASPDAPGAYQGVFQSGFAAAQMLAPIVATTAIHLGRPGWVVLTGIFVLAGAAFAPATRWAVHRHAIALPG